MKTFHFLSLYLKKKKNEKSLEKNFNFFLEFLGMGFLGGTGAVGIRASENS